MEASLHLNLPLVLLLSAKLLLSLLHLSIFVVASFAQIVSALSGKPGSDAALNVEGRVLSFLGPHARREVVLVRSNKLVLARIHVETGDLTLAAEADVHLHAHFSHHNSRLSLVLVSLDHALILFAMILESLIGLRESMMIDVAGLVVAEATEVRLGPLLLLNLDVDALDLYWER